MNDSPNTTPPFEDDPLTADPMSGPTAEHIGEPVRRFRRDPNGSIAGVATGIAQYFNIDPNLVKIAFAAGLVMSGGTLFLAYLAMWLLIPTSDDHDPRPFAITSRPAPIIFGTLLLTGAVSAWASGDGGALVLPALLVVGGVYLLTQQNNSDQATPDMASRFTATAPGAFTPPPPFQPAPPTADQSTYGWATPRLDDDPPPAPPGPTQQAEPAAPKPPITAVTLAAAAIFIAVLAMLDQFGADLGTRSYMGAAAAIIGIGLIVSSVIGRAWRLIPLGILAIAVMAIGPIFDGAASGGFGPKEVTVTSEAQLLPLYSVGAGYYELDLTQLELTEDRTIRVEVGAGYAEILVPRNTNVQVDAGTNFGYVELFGREVAGIANSSTSGKGLNDGPTLTIEASTEFGYVEVK